MDLEKLKYPIGKFHFPDDFGKPELQEAITTIEDFPEKLRRPFLNLKDEQLNTRYRPGGWSIRQVVHHCADSHINSLVRYKLALTENEPIIKPYFENLWAELADGQTLPIEPSLKIIDGLHYRWVALLKSLSERDFNKTFIHPEHNSKISLKKATAMYAWHCNHHLGHIIGTIEREGW